MLSWLEATAKRARKFVAYVACTPRVDNHRPRIAVIIIHIADWVGQTIELIIAKANICPCTQPWQSPVPSTNFERSCGLAPSFLPSFLPRGLLALPPSVVVEIVTREGRWPIVLLLCPNNTTIVRIATSMAEQQFRFLLISFSYFCSRYSHVSARCWKSSLSRRTVSIYFYFEMTNYFI